MNYLKIDHSIIEDLEQDPKNAAIVVAVITLAHALGIQTISERVETSGQLIQLRELGCDCSQGYYFYETNPTEAAIEAFLEI